MTTRTLDEAHRLIQLLLAKPRALAYSADEDEAEFIAFLALIQRNDVPRGEFVQLFQAMIRDEIPAPAWLIAFCMHVLRWPEVRQIALEECRLWKPATLSIASEVLDAYDEDWFGALIFSSFKAN